MDSSRTPDELKKTEGDTAKRKDKPAPAAGPHAAPDLTNEDATPGTGALPDAKSRDVDGGAG